MGSHTHSHSHLNPSATLKRISLALFITLGFIFVEVIAGWLANSLVLMSDAVHNLTDVIALALTAFAVRISLQPSDSTRTYGFHRAGILIALVNSVSLILVAGWIFYEAYQRLVNPPEVHSTILTGVGAAALLVNGVTAWLVMQGSERDLNLRSAFIHLMGDVFSTAGAVVAGLIMIFTGILWLDPLVGGLIGILILWNAWDILRETLEILLENTPKDVSVQNVISDILGVPGVKGMHDLHIWSISRSLRALSAHLLVEDISQSDAAAIRKKVEQICCDRYNISHSTLQLEHETCDSDDLFCQMK